MSELFETLEAEMKEANLNAQGEPIDDKNPDTRTDGTATGRAARDTGTPSQDKIGAPQKDDGAPRRLKPEPQADSKGTQGDDGASPESGSASQGGEDGVLADDKPLSPKEEAFNRRKIRESEAEIKRLKAELETARTPKAQEPVKQIETSKAQTIENPEPDKEKDLAGWLVWNAEEQRKWRNEYTAESQKTAEQRKVEGLVQSAQQEIETIQSAYKKSNPDYDNALTHAKSEYAKAVRVLMPQLTDGQIEQALQKEIFQIALKCNREGTNLGEVLYDTAIERFGYEPNGEVSMPKFSSKPNLRVVTTNKKRSASSLEGGGQRSGGRITIEQAANMSPGELQSLSSDDWSYLESQGF